MNLRGITAVSLASAGLLAGGSGVAHADVTGATFVNNSQVLSCFSLHVLDVPVLSANNTGIDCSTNQKRTEAVANTVSTAAPDAVAR